MAGEVALSDEAVVRYASLIESWNERDAGAFVSHFSSSGSVVGFDGSQMNGQAEILSELSAIFADHPTARYVAKVREVRPLGEDCVLLRAVVGMVPPGASGLNPAVNAIQSVVFERGDQGPRVALLQNTPAGFHGRPELSDELTRELSGLVQEGRTVIAG